MSTAAGFLCPLLTILTISEHNKITTGGKQEKVFFGHFAKNS